LLAKAFYYVDIYLDTSPFEQPLVTDLIGKCDMPKFFIMTS